MTGVAKNTIQKLTRELGQACLDFQNNVFRNLKSQRVQCDEIWCFCYAKEKNLPDEMRGQPGVGSMWTWTALDADTKLLFSWHFGNRDASSAYTFMKDIQDQLAHRVQLTTDSHNSYLNAVTDCFAEIDYAMLHKLYGKAETGSETRYSPPKCNGTKKKVIMGNPDPAHISTSYIERQNLNFRMNNRRYTRLTNAFSKKADMLAYSFTITAMYHNFVRIHQTLKSTPAMKAGVTDHLWSIEEMVDLLPEVACQIRTKKVSI
jgi:IS1 family transposase